MKGTSLCYTVMLELQLYGLPADSYLLSCIILQSPHFFYNSTMKSLMASLLGCVNETQATQ